MHKQLLDEEEDELNWPMREELLKGKGKRKVDVRFLPARGEKRERSQVYLNSEDFGVQKNQKKGCKSRVGKVYEVGVNCQIVPG